MMHVLLLESTDWSSRKKKKKKKQGKQKGKLELQGCGVWEVFFFFFRVRLWVSLLESVLQAWLCFYTGSAGSISVWGPVVGRSPTVAPHGAVFPPEFALLWSNVCLSSTILHLPPSLIPFFFYRFLFLSLSGVAPRLVCHHPFPPSKEDKACD